VTRPELNKLDRIPLARLVREFQRGESPQTIRSHYPALSLEQVYGAIAFYPGIGKRWKRTSQNASAKRMHSAQTHATAPAVKPIFERMRDQTASRRSSITAFRLPKIDGDNYFTLKIQQLT
jgi:hypothetical protein